MQAYIKIDEYIIIIKVFNSKYENRRKFYPTIYKIIMIKHMVTNEYIDWIELYDSYHFCSTANDNEYSLFNHNKKLHTNNIVIYKSICNTDNYIELNDNLVDLQTNNKISFCVIDKLYAAYIEESEAFYENFFEEEQWKLFPNGYSGICKKYEYKYGGSGNEIEEFYHSNGKKEGKHKIYYYNFYKNRIKSETNYINGIKCGEELHYDIDGNCIEKYNNYSDNFNFYEKLDKSGNIIKSGYYYMDIPITIIYNLILGIRNIFYL
jgi:hypothetical protein